jgi:hypothetical protein
MQDAGMPDAPGALSMALCLECNADYLRGITVCPACHRDLEPETAPEPVESVGFVPFMTCGYPEGLAAAASLEAAGLETRLTSMGVHVYLTTPMSVTVLVRERDLDAAQTVLRAHPAPAPPVREEPPPHEIAEHFDEEVQEVVRALNLQEGVHAVDSCSGAPPGGHDCFIAISPPENAKSDALFEAFVGRIQERIEASELKGRIAVHWADVHGAEITLVRLSGARETWRDLSKLITAC